MAQITKLPTGTQVHSRDQREVDREAEGAGGAGQHRLARAGWTRQQRVVNRNINLL
jgi:hypothetical protein